MAWEEKKHLENLSVDHFITNFISFDVDEYPNSWIQ